MPKLNRHWTEQSITDFLYRLGADFVRQLESAMENGPDATRTSLAKKLGVSKGRISQVLNNPGNLTIRKMIEYSRAVGLKVSVVAYDDGDHGNARGPIHADIFVDCWERAGKPVDVFDLQDRPTVSRWPSQQREVPMICVEHGTAGCWRTDPHIRLMCGYGGTQEWAEAVKAEAAKSIADPPPQWTVQAAYEALRVERDTLKTTCLLQATLRATEVPCGMCAFCQRTRAEAAEAALRWQSIETAPEDGTPFRAYGPELVDPDFNPWGQVEAVYEDDRLFGAIWDGQFDCWNSVDIGGKVTHWQPFPKSPEPQL